MKSKKILVPRNQNCILQEIFNYILLTHSTNKTQKILSPTRKPHLLRKIEINFNNKQLFVKRTIGNHLPNINLVKNFLENQIKTDDTPVINLVDRIQSLFLQFRKAADPNAPINDFQFFDRIAEGLIPPDKIGDTDYIAIAKATVLYVFEMCDIGKPPDDVPKPKPLTNPDLFE